MEHQVAIFCSRYFTYVLYNHHSLSGCLAPTVQRASVNKLSSTKRSLMRGGVHVWVKKKRHKGPAVDFTQAVKAYKRGKYWSQKLVLPLKLRLVTVVHAKFCENVKLCRFLKWKHLQTACWSYKNISYPQRSKLRSIQEHNTEIRR